MHDAFRGSASFRSGCPRGALMMRASSREAALGSGGAYLTGEASDLEGAVTVRQVRNGGIGDRSCGAADSRPRAATRPHGLESDPTGELFRLFATRVYGYVRLRATAELADDVVADTFLTAWRLRESVPNDPLPWLLVIARHALANRQRSARRGTRLVVAMANVAQLAHNADAAEEIAVNRAAVLAALAGLRPDDREALLLVAWDGLATADAATVAGCSERTFARRLRRARSQLNLAEAGLRTESTPAATLTVQNSSKDSR